MLGIFSSQSLTRVVVLCSLFILVCLGLMSTINHSLTNKNSSLKELALLLNSIQYNQARIIDARAELVSNKNQDTLQRLNSYRGELEENIQSFNESAYLHNIDEIVFEPSFDQNMQAYEEYINQIDSLQKSLLNEEGKGLLESHRLAWFLLYRSSLTYNSESLSTSLLNTQYSIDNFINRPDTANLRSANSLISKTQESIGREYQYLYQAFLTYENVFQYITDTYNEIGINDDSGIRRELSGLEYALRSYVSERQANFDSYAANQLTQNQNLYWVANGTLFLSVVLAVIYLIYKSASFENWMMASKTSAARLHRSKNQFLADVSNEIRTPLNGIIGMANFLSEDNLKSHQRDQVNIISNCSNKLLSLVNDVLDLSRIESGDFRVNPVVINTKQAVFDCVELYQQDA
ncbi:PAS/PAC sensor hybrid histidine kinase [Vibrio ishigakensis]|uniref:histidine kinase n=1 Tax=Vibrio ishigakensis TaxID=1481914 RepID=A0A0B8P3U0_9VIBR|nr:PAS/PAC sensor hybrid histidine kinase [Vibrio ishigakensis]